MPKFMRLAKRHDVKVKVVMEAYYLSNRCICCDTVLSKTDDLRTSCHSYSDKVLIVRGRPVL